MIYYYVWIKDLSRLVSLYVKKKVKKFICNRCLHYFYSEYRLTLHERNCADLNNCVNLPKNINQILRTNHAIRRSVVNGQ